MKKISIAIIGICILVFQNTSEAQVFQEDDIGIGEVIFANIDKESVAHSFLIHELSYKVIKLHLMIAGKNSETANYESETLTTIKNLEELTKTDVIELLNISEKKQETLAKYLADCDKNLQKWDSIVAYMKQEMAIFQLDMQSCIAEKNISDKVYFKAINSYDQKSMEEALKSSIEYETCATENRIQYNAKVSIVQKMVFYLWLLQKKYDVLFDKQDILSKNFEIFRDNILPDLNEIDQILKQYEF